MKTRRAINRGRVENEIIERLESVENENARLWDIVATCLNVAVCDHCKDRWFLAKATSIRPGVMGDENGLLVGGGSCCGRCLDILLEASADLEQEELDEVRRDLARWFNSVGRGWLSSTFWRKDGDLMETARRIAQ